MSTKTSTAALAKNRASSRGLPKRVPRHPAGVAAGLQTGKLDRQSVAPASIWHSRLHRHSERSLRSEDLRAIARFLCDDSLFYVRNQQVFQQAQITIRPEVAMKSSNRKTRNVRTILPVILRIALSLMLWTLGASMTLFAAEPKEHRVIHNFAVDRAKLESLQRWVNSGHDDWCRDPQRVAAESLQRVLPDDVNLELTSAPEGEWSRRTSAVYTIHTLDGLTIYRITLRRYRWLLPVAGSQRKTIWVPAQLEIVTHRDSDSNPPQGFVAAAF
jgi:hypothetical protein